MHMVKVSATQFKAKLGIYMQAVRTGKAVLITDRGVAVARLEPLVEAPVPAPAKNPRRPRLGSIEVRGVRVKGISGGDLLAEDRRR